MSLWWLQPGWTETRCQCCGGKIWPEGDPDMGVCFSCYQREWNDKAQQEDAYLEARERERYAPRDRADGRVLGLDDNT